MPGFLAATAATLDEVRRPVLPGLSEVDAQLRGYAVSGFNSLDEVGGYLLSRTGKLLRPTLALLADGLTGRPTSDGTRVASVVELLHVATLVHDDAVDHSVRRRGRPTVNAQWSHQVAIIAGDYLYSRAVIEAATLGRLDIIEVLASAANKMTIGEMRQLVLHDGLNFTRRDYDRLCEFKTASLMSAACELGAMTGAPEYREAMAEFGVHLGMAFQVVDDLIDYLAPEEITGKPRGQDLREHKVTLPLIAALDIMGPEDRSRVEALFADPDPSRSAVAEVTRVVLDSGGVEEAVEVAREHADKARKMLDGVPHGENANALREAVDYVVDRIN